VKLSASGRSLEDSVHSAEYPPTKPSRAAEASSRRAGACSPSFPEHPDRPRAASVLPKGTPRGGLRGRLVLVIASAAGTSRRHFRVFEYVGVYTYGHDGSAPLDWRFPRRGESGRSADVFDTFAPTGPVIGTTPDDMNHPHNLRIQFGSTATMQNSSSTKVHLRAGTSVVPVAGGDGWAGRPHFTCHPPGFGIARKPPSSC